MNGGDGRVLVVDDDPATVALVRDYLEREGATVSTTTDPAEALARIESEPFACVISDYDMPEMNGLELLDAVRNRDRTLQFVLYTGVDDESVARQARERSAVYVEKGTSTEPLAALAEQVPT